jgi:ubiquinone/menaquinone biosynthesis C-methylase UbiE
MFRPITNPRTIAKGGRAMATEDTEYALGRHSDEYGRLITQARQLEPLTRRVFEAAGIVPGMRVLDVGCGVGDVSMLLAQLVGSGGQVVGVDLDDAAIGVAKERCALQGLDHVDFVTGDARHLDDDGFDAVVGRFVLMYTTDPTETLRKLRSLVRPGGIMAFHEWISRPSAGLAGADQPALARLQGLLAATFARSGAHLEIGAELHDRMTAAGLIPNPNPIVEFAVHHGDSAEQWRRWADIGHSVLPQMIAYGLIDPEDGVHMLDVELREQLTGTSFAPLSPLMVGQWAVVPG